MTYEEIKKAINDRATEMMKANKGIATHADYRLGIICGMLEGFDRAGMLTKEERNAIFNEYFDIVF